LLGLTPPCISIKAFWWRVQNFPVPSLREVWHEIRTHHLANLLRKKVRLLLTIGSFAVALFLFVFLAVVRDAFNRGSDVAGADRLVVINRTSIINTIPLSYRDKILRIPGVKVVTHNNWFGGTYIEEKNFFPQ